MIARRQRSPALALLSAVHLIVPRPSIRPASPARSGPADPPGSAPFTSKTLLEAGHRPRGVMAVPYGLGGVLLTGRRGAAPLGLVVLGERSAPLVAVGALLVLTGLLVLAAQRRPRVPDRQTIRNGRPEPADFYSDMADKLAESVQGAGKTSAAAPTMVARIIDAAGAERRRLERNLHDGAQQRLVSLALALRTVETHLLTDPEAAGRLLATAREELALALEELRDLARGLHPAILTNRGLGPALNALAARAPVAVRVLALPQRRLPEPVEAAAYYLVAEAVTNVTRHARASVATVSVTRTDDRARVEVRDDGAGGAEIGHGSGLRGLADRLQALGGHLELESPPGEGTTLIGTIPLHRSASRPVSRTASWTGDGTNGNPSPAT